MSTNPVGQLRRLGIPDAAACAAIEAELFAGDDPWPEAAFVAEFSQPNNFYVGVFAPDVDELCGYAGITKLGPSGSAEYEIHTIGVAKRWQGQGLGRVLMDALMAAMAQDPGQFFSRCEPTMSLPRRCIEPMVSSRLGCEKIITRARVRTRSQCADQWVRVWGGCGGGRRCISVP